MSFFLTEVGIINYYITSKNLPILIPSFNLENLLMILSSQTRHQLPFLPFFRFILLHSAPALNSQSQTWILPQQKLTINKQPIRIQKLLY